MLANGHHNHDDTVRFRHEAERTLVEIKRQWTALKMIGGIVSVAVVATVWVVVHFSGFAKAVELKELAAELAASKTEIASVKTEVTDTHEIVHELFDAVMNGKRR